MNNVLSKIFFGAGLVAYGIFFVTRAQAFGIPEYSTDATILGVLGILGHFAFEKKAA